MDWCHTDVQVVHSLGLKAQDLEIHEKDDKKCIGHLRALCPWILIMLMIIIKKLLSND